jgi:hypothetical protein
MLNQHSSVLNKLFVALRLTIRRIGTEVLHVVIGMTLHAIKRTVPVPCSAQPGMRPTKRTVVRPTIHTLLHQVAIRSSRSGRYWDGRPKRSGGQFPLEIELRRVAAGIRLPIAPPEAPPMTHAHWTRRRSNLVDLIGPGCGMWVIGVPRPQIGTRTEREGSEPTLLRPLGNRCVDWRVRKFNGLIDNANPSFRKRLQNPAHK